MDPCPRGSPCRRAPRSVALGPAVGVAPLCRLARYASHPPIKRSAAAAVSRYIVRRGMRAAGGGPAPPGRAGGHVCTARVGRPRNDRRKRASDCVRSGAHGAATAARHDGALRRRPRRRDSQSGGFASAAQPPSRFHDAAALEPRRFLLELSPTGRSWLEKGRSRYDGGRAWRGVTSRVERAVVDVDSQ
jgi:hypothetical protein